MNTPTRTPRDPEPFHLQASKALYHGDVLDVLQTFRDDAFGLAFVDPPSNIGADYGEAGTDTWTNAEYRAWMLAVLREVNRVVRPGGVVIFWTLEQHRQHFTQWFTSPTLEVHGVDSFVSWHDGEPIRSYDPVVMYHVRDGHHIPVFQPMQWGERKESPNPGIGRNEQSWHPCPRPRASISWLLSGVMGYRVVGLDRSRFSTEPDLLDVFCGSGNVLYEAHKLRMSGVGIDLNSTYLANVAKAIGGLGKI